MKTFPKEKRRALLARLPGLIAQGLTARECADELGVTSDWCYRNMGPKAFARAAWKQEIAQRTASLRAWLFAGGHPKDWARENDMEPQAVSKFTDRAGFRKYYLTKEEYAHILSSRKQRKAA